MESNDIVKLLQDLIVEVRKGHVINLDGRVVSKILSPAMNNALRNNSNEDDIGRGVLV